MHRAVLLLAFSLHAGAAWADGQPFADAVSASQARAMVQRTVELVEAKGLPPRDPLEYAQAKRGLLALVEGTAQAVERPLLLYRLNALLRTLDVDGHSFVRPPTPPGTRVAAPAGAQAPVTPGSSLATISTARGKVLHWTPPQTVGDMDFHAPRFLQRLQDDAAKLAELEGACALVVDLSAQHGGNAWPPFIPMHPLFTSANTAAFVSRDGQRARFVRPQNLVQLERRYGGGKSNPLARFAGTPLAVVVGPRTSSAGEMLLVALMGEGERTRTFGYRSQGMTTANSTYPLADGSTLVLSQARYALGDAPVIRGGIPVQVPAAAGATQQDVLRQAAEWAAAGSALCRPEPATEMAKAPAPSR